MNPIDPYPSRRQTKDMSRFILRFSIFALLIFTWGPRAHASTERENLRVFLQACGYGLLGGAALGAASLAVVEDPNSKVSNIAKGASLGLYAGIGFGLYQIYANSGSNRASAPSVAGIKIIPHLDGVLLFSSF